MATRVLTAHVPVELAEKVDQMAERLERSRGWIVKQALSNWVDEEEGRRTTRLCRPGPTVLTVASLWRCRSQGRRDSHSLDWQGAGRSGSSV